MSTPHHDLPGVDAVQPVDPDLAEQAVPGHGIPSQDPAGAAQVGLLPEEAQREAKSAFVGGGAVAGLAAGAAVGAVVGGPIGVVVGGTVGTLAGLPIARRLGANAILGRRLFAGLILIVAVYVAIKAVTGF